MHILRWLMKHPIMLAWLLAIVAILLNFGVGMKHGEEGKEMAAEHNAPAPATEQAATPAAAPAEQQAVVAPAAATEQAAAPAEQQQAVAPAAATEQAATPAAAPAEQQAVVAPAAATEQAAAPAEQQQAVAPAAATEQTAVQAAAPAEQAAAPVVADQAAAQQPSASANAPADLLRAAREAYWANELDRAVGLYTDLLKQTPDSLEYKGELANVYWKQGNAQQAATLFTEVAPKLAEQGRTTEALNMKLYVDMVSPDLAKKIDAALKK